jgi:hypothetical protein
MTTNNERVVPLSKVKVLLLIFGSIVFVALGFWMFQLDSAWIESQRRFNSPTLVHGVGIIAVVFFGFCGAAGIRKLFDRRPGLVLNAAGIMDNSSGASAGLIPWADIERFETSVIQKQRLLVVKLVAPEKYVSSGGSFRRALNRANMKLVGSPVAIASNALKIDFDGLVALCNDYFARYRVQGPSRNGS